MKPTTEPQNFVLSTASETIKMGIDAASTAHIISLLTDLYSDKETAVIREYSTNAWDSHQEAGNPDPIEITRPTLDDPTFRVRDRGVGLSKVEIAEIYSMYGASTKRETNDATGMLGLGCKSALTYAPQFTVDAVKDGRRTLATVGKGVDGIGEINVLLDQPTTQPNGVEIAIPVSAVRAFNDKIDQFFFYWRSGVLVNGEAPEDTIDGENSPYTQIDPDVYVKPQNYSKHVIVQGNVPYKYDDHRRSARPSERNNHLSIVSYVPIGVVDFTPSREDLHHTHRTDEVIEDIMEFVERTMFQSFQDELHALSNDWDRLVHFMKWQSLLPNKAATQIATQGRKFRDWPTDDRGWKVQIKRSSYNPKEAGLTRKSILRFPVDEASQRRNEKAFFVTGFLPKSFSNAHFDRLVAAGLVDEDLELLYTIPASYDRVVDTSSFPGVRWENVPELPRKARQAAASGSSSNGGPVMYHVHQGEFRPSSPKLQSDFTTTEQRDTVYHVVTRKKVLDNEAIRFLNWFTSMSLVVITPRQEGRFNKKFPGIISMDKFIEQDRENTKRQITPEIEHIINRPRCVEEFSKFMQEARAKDITNPYFLALKKAGDRTLDETILTERLGDRIRFHGIGFSQTNQWETTKRFEEYLSANYPLLMMTPRGYHVRRSESNGALADKHAIDYINRTVPSDWRTNKNSGVAGTEHAQNKSLAEVTASS